MLEGIFGPILLGKIGGPATAYAAGALGGSPAGIAATLAAGLIRGGHIMTFHEVEREYKGRFGAHMVHLRKPLLEWAGNDLIKIDMKIKLNAAWCGDPNVRLNEWHYLHENGIAAPLVIGGRPMAPDYSLFVITQMKESHRHWLTGGRLISVDLDITFEEYIPFAEGAAGVSFAGGIPGFG